MAKSTITERTYYPFLIEVIQKIGGKGVQEVRFNSYPDIVFELSDFQWILSVKVGEDSKTIKDAFLQYMRHKDESGINFGILLLLPELMKQIPAKEDYLRKTIQTVSVTSLIDTPLIKEEIRNRTFPEMINLIKDDLKKRLLIKEKSYYSLPLVISLLKEQVSEMMQDISLDENTLLRIITNKDLLIDIGHLKPKEAEYTANFLASYIFMSQVLFLRLFVAQRSDALLYIPSKPITHHSIRESFKKILEINYRPIYSVDVLDVITEKFLKDTFDLIWGLEIENARYELPGRIFHELMPSDIRKMLAAFYTRPVAAEILAKLVISRQNERVFDPASGSGTILVSAYRQKLDIFEKEGKFGNPHKRFCEEEIFGADIMPFAVHLTSANLAAMDATTTINRTQIIQGDSLQLGIGKSYKSGINQLSLLTEIPEVKTTKGEIQKISIENIDTVLMNPPFTKVERGIKKFVSMEHYNDICGGEIGLWGHFIALSNVFLKDDGNFGAVIPINILRGRESAKVRSIIFNDWSPIYIIKAAVNYGFSEWSEYRDVLCIAKKNKPHPDHKVKFCLIKKDLTKLNSKDTEMLVKNIKDHEFIRTNDLDINSYNLRNIKNKFNNLMWFCGGINFSYRDQIVNFIHKFDDILDNPPKDYFSEGYRPVPKGVSQFLFLTRNINISRIRKAFLWFDKEETKRVVAISALGINYEFNKKILLPSLRTTVGLSNMEITNNWDYIVFEHNDEIKRLCMATGFNLNSNFNWSKFWSNLKNEAKYKKTNLVVSHRINPFSPSTSLIAFYSENEIFPSNQVTIINEKNPKFAKAICVILNSIIFLTQFFLL